MLYPYISEFNWLDLIAIAVILRMCYIGIKRGFVVEAFKAFNIVICSFVALHFYYGFGELLHSIIKPFPVDSASIFCYVFLLCLITLIFRVLREGFFIFFKSEAIGTLSKIGGSIIGVLRGVVICGLISYGLMISNNYYFDLSTRTSILNSRFVKTPVKIYESLLRGIAFRVLPEENMNSEVKKTLEKKPTPEKTEQK